LRADTGKPLAEIIHFSRRCCELFLPPEQKAVFTNTDRLDGKVGSADLLIIRDEAVGAG